MDHNIFSIVIVFEYTWPNAGRTANKQINALKADPDLKNAAWSSYIFNVSGNKMIAATTLTSR